MSLLFRSFFSIIYTLVFLQLSFAQDEVFQTFNDTRVINSHSVEVLPHKKFDLRISHRFGDMFGDNGGWSTLYGIENASDILFGLDYGVSDYITIGIARTKGSGPLQKLINGSLKVNLQKQSSDGSRPFTVTGIGQMAVSTMGKSTNPEDLNNFDNFFERTAFNAQLMIARKFSPIFSLQLNAGYTYRNVVSSDDVNGLVNLGANARIRFSRVIGMLLDFNYPISEFRKSDLGYYLPLGVGFEFYTGGHVFQVNFTNATGILESDFIPYTRTQWSEGEFRLGFTISRTFNL